MIQTSADAVASASTSTASGFSASSAAPTVVASTVPLANAEQLAQKPVASNLTASTQAPAEEGGMPQLRTQDWPGQILWLLVIFAVFFVLMSRVFAPRLRKVIDRRGETIAEELANARANRDEAEAQAKQAAAETAEAHATARKMAQEAVARSNAEIAALQAAEDVKLNARLSEADGRIKAARDEAMTHVRDIASGTAQALVEKLTGKSATAAALRSAFEKV
ncbi:MAG: F0F1 ATP synthase subunit B family protein [Asticcacaulis sp.]